MDRPNTDLGPMGTATAESLRAVGLEPETPPALPAPLPVSPVPERQLDPRPRTGFAWPLAVRVLATAGAMAWACVAITSIGSVRRNDVQEIARQVQGYMQALYEIQRLDRQRVDELERSERDLADAVARAVRAERRARRLANGRRP